MSKIIMTDKELIEKLKTLESRPTFYKNKYPYNLLYVHSDGRTSADCVNLYKALLNGYDINNRAPGYYQSNLSNTGDCTEWGLLRQCSDISADFSKLNGEPRILYMSGHIGGYIGDFEKYGHVYNVCECTSAWGGGILFSYVDSRGYRYKSKGGALKLNGKGQPSIWMQHGKMTPWIKYTADQEIDEASGTFEPVAPPSNIQPGAADKTRHEGSSVAHYISDDYKRAYKVAANTGLNLRDAVGLSGGIICVMPFGSMVNCYGYYDLDGSGDIWLYVAYGNKTGFCSSKYLN